jgi:predicted metalloendopeptidase
MRKEVRLGCSFLAAVACAAVVTSAVGDAAIKNPAAASAASPPSGIILDNLDPKVRPQDDLFQYANGKWLSQVPIPEDESSWGIYEMMTRRALEALHELLDRASQGDGASDGSARKAAAFYASFMDETRLEALGCEPIRHELETIAAISDHDALSEAIATLSQVGVNTPISLSIEPDARHSTVYAVTLAQAGLGLPDRDYYLSATPRTAKIRKQYETHLARLLALSGSQDARTQARDILFLETRLAKIQWSDVANLDPVRTYNRIALGKLDRSVGALGWPRYLEAAGVNGKVDALVVAQPSYFKGLAALLRQTSLGTWKAYLRARLVEARAPYLNRSLADESFAFEGTILSGTPRQKPRWERAVEVVDRLLGDASGKLYVEHYFPAENKVKVTGMVRHILAAYAKRIDEIAWMSDSTKAEARAKLAKIRVKVGYPEHWRDYAGLAIDPHELVENIRAATAFEAHRKRALLGQPIDTDDWQMTAPTVNAYYDATRNEIVFPAGILQPPAYVADADDAFNYGSTGATIGHEISHGFDEQGNKFDSDGNLRNWWSEKDHARFAQSTRRLVSQYDGYFPLPGMHINGALTQGENIADLAGLEIAYLAYDLARQGRPGPIIDHFSADQRFYIGYAQGSLEKRRDEALTGLLMSDPHAPEKYRVNGVVVQMPSFYAAFGVKRGDGMYLDPEHRVTLWSLSDCSRAGACRNARNKTGER